MKVKSKEDQPALVFERAKQVGEAVPQGHAEPSVWSSGMLTALSKGVQGGKWFSLGDKVFRPAALEAAFTKVKANSNAAGVDGWTVQRFDRERTANLTRIHEQLMRGEYLPRPVKRVWIPKPGSNERRPLGIPTVSDRVVQTALRFGLDPIFEKEFRDSSFGFRPGRSCRQALQRVWHALKDGKVFVVDADLKRFFDTIPHEVILRGLGSKVSDGKILSLIRAYLAQGVMEGGVQSPDEEPEIGTPQGSPLSPLLANIALHGLDVLVEDSGYEIVRYADDFVILCKSMDDAKSALAVVEEWTERNGLKLHPDKTRIVDYGAGESFEFLGYVFRKGSLFPRKKSIKKLRDKVRSLTPRGASNSLTVTIQRLNPVLRGWFNYFRGCPEHVFRAEDGFVRRRLRATLAYSNGMSPWSFKACFARWPNTYLAKTGLYSMQEARQLRSTPKG